ncbi:alpha-galactosidase [Actinoalloteichus hoggarensis]|uniref:alpha-galactosidase n=1 Tax=Actinoalloteichus hoggarensis TaxID=1470176 RepID=A0A221W4U1_9PSEU|nr:alpha-galactosidase [Actinoalloteichus hoggarensis]ASO20902.1 Alpha-galactosidase [Actinoalloteichus hoggarensis]MBB5920833.1 alpha-galactosidase [Actinoalloteichus hoggarensis]
MPLPPADAAPIPDDGAEPEDTAVVTAVATPEAIEIVEPGDAPNAVQAEGHAVPRKPARGAPATGTVVADPSSGARLIHLRAAGVSLVLSLAPRRLPSVLHWGADLGDVDGAMLTELHRASIPAPAPNDVDEPPVIGVDVLPEHASGWRGRPGLTGQRDGRGWSPLIERTALDIETWSEGGGRVVVDGVDAESDLAVRVEIEMLPTGLLRQRAGVTANPAAPDTAGGVGSADTADGCHAAAPGVGADAGGAHASGVDTAGDDVVGTDVAGTDTVGADVAVADVAVADVAGVATAVDSAVAHTSTTPTPIAVGATDAASTTSAVGGAAWSAARQSRDTPYALGGLTLALPVPPVATELFDLAGRWGRERAPQRAPFLVGSHTRENRRGRTGADAPLILAAGTEGFDFRSGEVWAVHVAWSGNQLAYAERLADGTAVLGGGELLAAGEVRLAAGEGYVGPWLYAAYGIGFDGVAARFHEHLRARPHHPRRARPVMLNTWEAVYFDHDLDRLVELARRGAEVGVERYVLDDGWFRHRRHDRAGLGDWYVDPDVWPDGLTPLIEQVRALGMEFGLWFEPEMVNPDSDLARAHPDWILGFADRTPLLSRNQLVLDLGNPEVFAYLLERLDSLLSEYDISYVKWDHNRDLIDAGRPPTGAAGVHQQTLAVYRLLDELRSRHPDVEIESCSSGGLRIDLGILERADRVWGSDVIDPLERQQIQRWTSQLLPPELVGSHVGAPRAHTTARTHALSFRAGTALFGSFGIEWDLTSASEQDRAELAEWVALYKELRPLLHTGTLVRAEQHDPSFALHGIVARDGGEGVFSLVQLATPVTAIPGVVRLPGLDPERDYDVAVQAPGHRPALRMRRDVPWIDGGARLSGRVLDRVGLRAPAMHPEQLLLIRARAVPR